MGSGGPRKQFICWGSRFPIHRANFDAGKGWPTVNHRDYLLSPVQKWLNRSKCISDAESGGFREPRIRWWYTAVQPGEYDWTVREWQWCRLTSNYFHHLFTFVKMLIHQKTKWLAMLISWRSNWTPKTANIWEYLTGFSSVLEQAVYGERMDRNACYTAAHDLDQPAAVHHLLTNAHL